MKTGFTCPAGFNVVASANHRAASDRRGARGAIGESAQPRGRRSLRPRLRERRGRGLAGIAAGRLGARRPTCAPKCACTATRPRSQPQRTTAFPTRPRPRRDPPAEGLIPTPLAAFFAPVAAHTELPDGRIHFDPVRVYIGPAPGWKGPALGARQTTEATAASGGAKVIHRRRRLRQRDYGGRRRKRTRPGGPSSRSQLKHSRHARKTRRRTSRSRAHREKVQKKDVSTD